jgi:hypothetical protein
MYNSFDDWFYEIEIFSTRSERFFADIECGDPLEKQKKLIEWLTIAWQLGKESNKNEKAKNYF